MAKLKKLSLEDVEPMTSVSSLFRPMRLDEAKQGLTQNQTFQNAPAVKMDHFSVPKTVK
jgi:aspartyl/glutamyl-tRNA(Asn/Gln) amidotransferase C subunit